jgi:hypothetical protein
MPLYPSVRILPFVLLNAPLYLGTAFGEVPIVDLMMLTCYVQDAMVQTNVQRMVMEKHPIHSESIEFYATEGEAADRIENYLASPPQFDLWKRQSLIKWQPIISMDETERVISFERMVIMNPLLQDDLFDSGG